MLSEILLRAKKSMLSLIPMERLLLVGESRFLRLRAIFPESQRRTDSCI
nr:MAG TPA: hypothetical protein [Bacteriophage sp.]